MQINHLAIYTTDLQKMKHFYETYFAATAGNLYHNPQKQFHSYFLSFDSGCRLELMHRPDVPPVHQEIIKEYLGLTHIAISVGSKVAVNTMTERLRTDGYQVIGEPRTTGDGYYESVVLDPENNRIEITV